MAQTWRQPDWPEVSVSVVTFNQRQLIGRALDSILSQQVNFSYEIVVGDDCSDDGTREVLLDYQQRHPDVIRLRLYDRRQPGIPGRRNNMDNPMACRGRYTALLDGDDYWTDPHKLQLQYEMMQRHPRLSACAHETLVAEVDHDGRPIEPPMRRGTFSWGYRTTGFYSHEAFCYDRNLGLHTSSWFFRTRIFGDWPPGYERVVAADHYFFLLISQRGPVYYDDTIRSTYERQPASLTNSGAYLDGGRVLQRIRDLRTYRQRFPATTITASYSAFAVRQVLMLLRQVVKNFPSHSPSLPYLLLQIAREPRGLAEVIRYRLAKTLRQAETA